MTEWIFFPKPFSYHFCSLTRCSIMLQKVQFITRLFWTFWPCSLLVGNIKSEPPPKVEKQTHTWPWHVSGCFGVALPTYRAHLFLPRQTSFQMPQTIRQEINQRKWLHRSPLKPCIFCGISACPLCFSWREEVCCCSVWADGLTPAWCLFLSKPCTSDNPVLLSLPPWSILHNNQTPLLRVLHYLVNGWFKRMSRSWSNMQQKPKALFCAKRWRQHGFPRRFPCLTQKEQRFHALAPPPF